MRTLKLTIIVTLLTCTLYGQNQSLVREMVNSVNRDSLLSYVKRLEAFGTRYEYTPQRDSAAEYIHSAFSRWGLQSSSDRHKFGENKRWDAALRTKDSLWVVGVEGMFLFSSDGGNTWKVQALPAGSQDLFGITMLPNGLGIAVGASGTILRTTDAGAHWSLDAEVTKEFLLSVSFGNPTTGVIVGFDGTILRTTTAGASWENVGSDTLGLIRAVQFISPSAAIAVTDLGDIIRSTDAGETWKISVSTDGAPLYSVHFPDSLNGFVCGKNSLLLKTTDGGSTWAPMVFPLEDINYFTGVFFTDPLHGCLVGNTAEIFLTADGGESWKKIDGTSRTSWGPFIDNVRGIPGERMLVMGTRSLLLTSSDDGATWADYSNTLPSFLFTESRNIVATIPGSITPEIECVLVAHYDSDSDNPSVLAPGADDNGSGTAAVLEAARICSQYRFASTVKIVAVSAKEVGLLGSEHYAGMAKKENRNIKGAVNADMIGYPLNGDTLHLMAGSFEKRDRLVDSAIVYNQRYGIGLNIVTAVDDMRRSDYESFARAGYDALGLSEATDDYIWPPDNPFYHSTYDKADKLNFGLVRRAAQLMLAAGAEMAGVMEKTTGIEEAGNVQPKEFLLQQNYPNPFNPATTIVYQLPRNAIVTLKIYDMLGREVQTLVNEYKTAGYYTAAFNASDLASGIYVYRLVSYPTEGGAKDLFTAAKKMVLVK